MDMISSPHAPAAIGPYAQAIRSGRLVFCSGQLALDPASMQLVPGGAAEQTHQILQNLAAVLATAGTSLAKVLKTTVFLKDMGDFAAMNAVYAKAFGAHTPARSTVEVARLPKDALVEIECIATV
ncbi:MAG: RidA family protein [Lentisphaerae bacterium]|nr:RidA family protein [Lentisphaerota bacterium]